MNDILIPVALVRLHRDKCGSCQKRRVLFVLTVYDVPRGLALCATCVWPGPSRLRPDDRGTPNFRYVRRDAR